MNKIIPTEGIKIPIYVLEKNDKIEDIKDSMAYVVGKDGLYIKKSNRLYTSVTKIKEVECLAEVKTTAEVKFTKMKHDTFLAIETFFADIYKKFKSEVAILLYYSFDKKEWGWLVPKQTVAGASVDYKVDESSKFVTHDGKQLDSVPEGFSQMGSIHSHASMSAFHSGTDDKDEFHFDGLHITIGSFNSLECSYSVRWIVSGTEIKSSLENVVEGVKHMGKYPDSLSELVSEKVTVASNVGGYNYANYGKYGNQKGYSKTYNATASHIKTTPKTKPKTNNIGKQDFSFGQNEGIGFFGY
jgi:hypothetical protein